MTTCNYHREVGVQSWCASCRAANEPERVDRAAFEREAYLSLADEFDPMGATTTPTLDDFDPEFVEAARAFAARLAIPLPWDVRSIDNAAEYVRLAERTDR